MKWFSSTVIMCACAAAHAQSTFIVNDRTMNAMWRMSDTNTNGVIEEPGELNLFFDATNQSGVIGPDNPSSLAISAGGLVLMGDQLRRIIFALRDLNADGDAQDAGEALVAVDATNLSGASLAFPTGMALDESGTPFHVNAGNSFGPDAVYRMQDLTGDGDFQDAGEITVWVGEPFFGPGNGVYSPQELVFVGGAAYLRNSSSNLHSILRFTDANANGRADDPGESTVFFDATNASGVVIGPAFAIDVDRARPRSFYTLNLISPGVDELIRVSDVNADGDAQDVGEAVVVFRTGESGFTSVDVICLETGQVVITDNSGTRLIVLTDLNGDGLFDGPGERQTMFTNSSALVGDVRQVSPMPRACYADCDPSTGVGVLDIFDFLCFQNRFANTEPYACECDTSTGTGVCDIFDFLCFQNAFAAGCP